jgi:plastocyanin
MKQRFIQSGILAFSMAIFALPALAADCPDCARMCASGMSSGCSCCGGAATTSPNEKTASNLWEFVGNATVLATAQTVDVTIGSNFFSAKDITINLGDTVRWTVVSGFHTVTSDTNAWATSGTLGTGNTFLVTFNSLGLFPYYCQFHGGPGGSGMAGTVTVVAVPEPQSFALLIIGCAAFSAAAWRRRQRS